jgi:hypothetical protein
MKLRWNPTKKQIDFINDDRPRVMYGGGQPPRADSEWIRRLFVENPKLKRFITYGTHGDSKEIWASEVSDGYHTFTELYNHRIALWMALCKIYDNYITPLQSRIKCWKSKQHNDGSMFNGWFILGMEVTEFTGPKIQLTYHLPLEYWDKINVIELERAPKWDGHSPQDVIERLAKL